MPIRLRAWRQDDKGFDNRGSAKRSASLPCYIATKLCSFVYRLIAFTDLLFGALKDLTVPLFNLTLTMRALPTLTPPSLVLGAFDILISFKFILSL